MVTLWVIISPNKHILVKIRLEKVDLGEVYIQKEQENFKKRSSSDTIGGSLHMSHPVDSLTKPKYQGDTQISLIMNQFIRGTLYLST